MLQTKTIASCIFILVIMITQKHSCSPGRVEISASVMWYATVIIKKTGFCARDWNPRLRRYVEKRIKDPMRVIGRMNDVVEIEEGVTFGDLIKLFRRNYDPIKEFVALLVDCNLNYWGSIDERYDAKKEDTSDLYAIEIYCYAEIDNHEEKAKLPKFDFAYGCHGLAASGRTARVTAMRSSLRPGQR